MTLPATYSVYSLYTARFYRRLLVAAANAVTLLLLLHAREIRRNLTRTGLRRATSQQQQQQQPARADCSTHISTHTQQTSACPTADSNRATTALTKISTCQDSGWSQNTRYLAPVSSERVNYLAAARDSESGLMRWACPSVCPFACPFLCRSPKCVHKNTISQKLSSLEL